MYEQYSIHQRRYAMGTENTDAKPDFESEVPDVEEQEEVSTNQDKDEKSNESDIDTQVNSLVESMVQDDDGKWQFPDGTKADPAIMYAAKAERRRRDTQASYTKSRQEAKKLQTVNEKLQNEVLESATVHFSDEEREELDELKMRDPDKWHSRLTELTENKKKTLKDKLADFDKEGERMSELEIRKAKVQAFNESTGLELNDQVIEEQLPAAFTKQLENGDIDFDKFLEKAAKFLQGQVKIKGSEEPSTKSNPDMSKMAGKDKPTPDATSKDIIASYDNEIY